MRRRLQNNYCRLCTLCRDNRKFKWFKILKVLLVLFVLFLSLWIFHIESYVWQVTTMRSYFHSDVDHKCPTSSVFNGASNNISSTRYSIGILVIYKDDGNNQWGDSLMKRILVNREKYAAKHGYKVLNGNDLIDSSRPVAWSKLKAVEAHLSSFDYIFYIDMDAIIMNMNRPLHDFIQIANNHHKTHEETTSPSPSPPIDLIMTADWNGPNTGVWLARNSTWTHWFLNLLWEQKQFTQEKSPSGTPYPFEYEQRAFHYILDTNIWRKRKLPRYSGNSAEIRNHVVVLPQCTFNSYSLHPFDGRGRFDEAQYVEGDFIIHFAGKKGRIKLNLMDHYLRIVESITN